MFLPRADFLADVRQVVKLCHVLRRAEVTIGFDGRRQLPNAGRRSFHQPLAGSNDTAVFLRPISVLVFSRFLATLVIIEDVAERVVGVG